jgi:hypothetical protein
MNSCTSNPETLEIPFGHRAALAYYPKKLLERSLASSSVERVEERELSSINKGSQPCLLAREFPR